MNFPLIEVSEPFFTFLVKGPKKVEGRKASEKWLELVDWFKDNNKFVILDNKEGKRALFRLVDIRRWSPKRPYLEEEDLENYILTNSGLRVYLEQEGLRNTLPGVNKVEDGVNVYRQWSTDKELLADFLAIEMVWVRNL